MSHPTLPPHIEVLEGTDLVGEWNRFRIFEALHHRMRICNPISGGDLDGIVDAWDPGPGESLLDIACGHGELTIRTAERAAVRGRGIDKSPWALLHAADEASKRPLRGEVHWVLGDAHGYQPKRQHDLVACIGASWIWHGFAGTARAVIDRTLPGGGVAIGDVTLLQGAEPDQIAEEYGRVLSPEDQLDILRELGCHVTARFDATPDTWDAYEARILDSAETYLQQNPGPEATQFMAEQQKWAEDHTRDRAFLTFTIWVGRVAG